MSLERDPLDLIIKSTHVIKQQIPKILGYIISQKR